MHVKFEKITLWISLDTYGVDDRVSALDVIVPAVRGLESDFTLLDYDGEDYKLVKVRKGAGNG
jgi:hypothetical protein